MSCREVFGQFGRVESIPLYVQRIEGFCTNKPNFLIFYKQFNKVNIHFLNHTKVPEKEKIN